MTMTIDPESNLGRRATRIVNQTLDAFIDGRPDVAPEKQAKRAIRKVRQRLTRLGMSDDQIAEYAAGEDLEIWALFTARSKAHALATADEARREQKAEVERDYRLELRAAFPALSDADLAPYLDNTDEGARLLADKARADRLTTIKRASNPGVGFNPRAALSLADLDELADPEWLVADIVPENTVGGVVGESGSLKSAIALDWACSLAVGIPAFGELATAGPRRVLYVAGEGAFGFRRRIAAFATHRELDRDARALLATNIVVYPSPVNLLSSDETSAARAFVDQEQFDLVIFDTLSTHFAGADENSATEMAAALRLARHVVDGRPQASAVIVHHTPKAGGLDGRGSGAFKSNLDWMIATERDGELVRLSTEKQKDSAIAPPRVLRKVVIDLAASTSASGVRHAGSSSVAVELVALSDLGAFAGRRGSLAPAKQRALETAFTELIQAQFDNHNTPSITHLRELFRREAKDRIDWSALTLRNGAEKTIVESLARAGVVTLGRAGRAVLVYPPNKDLPPAVDPYDLPDLSPPEPLDTFPLKDRKPTTEEKS